MVGDNPVKFGGNRHCGSGRIMVLVCHMILQDNVIKGSYDSVEISSLRHVNNLPCLMAISTVLKSN